MCVTQSAPAALRFINRVKDACEQPGVYALWCLEGNRLSLLNVKESANIKITLLIYHQLLRGHAHAHNRIVFSACYAPGSNADERRTLSEKFKKALPPEYVLR